MTKLTWIKGQHASWEGVEMNNLRMMNRFGCLELIYGENDEIIGFIDLDNTYLIGNSERKVILKLIRNYTEEYSSYSFDNSLDEAHGFANETKNLRITRVSDLINDIENFVFLNKLPESVNVIDYQEFMEEIDKYFDDLHKKNS
jgi:glucan phosphorylase